MKGWFVTGTDTDCGKTAIAAALACKARRSGMRVGVMKPVASGCHDTTAGLRNPDALALIDASETAADYEAVNPYAFAPPIAPHVAAEQVGVALDRARLIAGAKTLGAGHDLLIVECAGGWRVPLGADWDMADLAVGIGLPVILVVGFRLGCLNHALLTAEAIARDGCRLAGWVANHIDPQMAVSAENLATLRTRLASPCLGVVPYLPDASPDARAACLTLP